MFVYNSNGWGFPTTPIEGDPNLALNLNAPRMSEDEAVVAHLLKTRPVEVNGERKMVTKLRLPDRYALENDFFLSVVGLSPAEG